MNVKYNDKLILIAVEEVLANKISPIVTKNLQNVKNPVIMEIIWKKPAQLDLFFITEKIEEAALMQFFSFLGIKGRKEESIGRLAFIHDIILSSFDQKEHKILEKSYYSSLIKLKRVNHPVLEVKSSDSLMIFFDSLLHSSTDIPEFLIYQVVFKPGKLFQERYRYKMLSDDTRKYNLQKRTKDDEQSARLKWGDFQFDLQILVLDKKKEFLEQITREINLLASTFNLGVNYHLSSSSSFIYRWRLRNMLRFSKRPKKGVNGFDLLKFIIPPNPRHFNSYRYLDVISSYKFSNVPSEFFDGDIFIGYLLSDDLARKSPLYFSWKHVNTHISIFGMTGEGKTRLSSNIVKQLIKKGVHCIIFDPKGEYRIILSDLIKESSFTYFKPGGSKNPLLINIFEIPKDENGDSLITSDEHQSFLIPALEKLLEKKDDVMSPQMRRLLYEAITETVNSDGSLKSFMEILENPYQLEMKGSYLENSGLALINRLAKLTFGTGKAIFNCEKSNMNLEEILTSNVIIDLSLMEATEDAQLRTLLIDYFMHYLFHYLRMKKSPVQMNEKPTNVILIDEVQKILPFNNDYQFSVTGQAPWTLRSYGISMIFVGTDPYVERPILTNTGIAITFFSKASSKTMAALLGMSLKEYEQLRALYNLLDTKYKAIISYRGKIFLVDMPINFNDRENEGKAE